MEKGLARIIFDELKSHEALMRFGFRDENEIVEAITYAHPNPKKAHYNFPNNCFISSDNYRNITLLALINNQKINNYERSRHEKYLDIAFASIQSGSGPRLVKSILRDENILERLRNSSCPYSLIAMHVEKGNSMYFLNQGPILIVPGVRYRRPITQWEESQKITIE